MGSHATSRYTRRDSDDMDARPAYRREYPTSTGGGVKGGYPQPGDGVVAEGDNEDNTRCWQCGYPLSNPGSNCDLCASDNYEGDINEP